MVSYTMIRGPSWKIPHIIIMCETNSVRFAYDLFGLNTCRCEHCLSDFDFTLVREHWQNLSIFVINFNNIFTYHDLNYFILIVFFYFFNV